MNHWLLALLLILQANPRSVTLVIIIILIIVEVIILFLRFNLWSVWDCLLLLGCIACPLLEATLDDVLEELLSSTISLDVPVFCLELGQEALNLVQSSAGE